MPTKARLKGIMKMDIWMLRIQMETGDDFLKIFSRKTPEKPDVAQQITVRAKPGEKIVYFLIFLYLFAYLNIYLFYCFLNLKFLNFRILYLFYDLNIYLFKIKYRAMESARGRHDGRRLKLWRCPRRCH
jgi:hypothetical protein